MKKVYFIEDQTNEYPISIRELEKIYHVEIIDSVESAIYNLDEIIKSDLIILDVMMDFKPFSREVTDDGMITGWVFYDKYLRNIKIPIIIWTNHASILDRNWGGNVHTFIKNPDDYFQLVNISKKILGEKK